MINFSERTDREVVDSSILALSSAIIVPAFVVQKASFATQERLLEALMLGAHECDFSNDMAHAHGMAYSPFSLPFGMTLGAFVFLSQIIARKGFKKTSQSLLQKSLGCTIQLLGAPCAVLAATIVSAYFEDNQKEWNFPEVQNNPADRRRCLEAETLAQEPINVDQLREDMTYCLKKVLIQEQDCPFSFSSDTKRDVQVYSPQNEATVILQKDYLSLSEESYLALWSIYRPEHPDLLIRVGVTSCLQEEEESLLTECLPGRALSFSACL